MHVTAKVSDHPVYLKITQARGAETLTKNKPGEADLKQQLRHMLHMDIADLASVPGIKRRLIHLLRFCYRLLRRFVADQCIQRASALAYFSLLAIVPLVALGMSAFTSFHAFDAVAGKISDLLLSNLLPTSHDVVQNYLGGVADKATALSVFGIIGLLITSTALLNTVEEAFNHVWRITRSRPLLSKFIAFWSTLTLAPIMIGASITITSYFAALPLIDKVSASAALLDQVPFVLPWLMSSLALAILYVVLPNTRVPFRFAIVGGLAAGALFELSKIGFAFYVTHMVNYEKLYGALGTLPVFLIWLYLVWVLVLIGSEIVFCLQHPEQSAKRHSALSEPGIRKFFSHLILLRAALAQQQGKTLKMTQLTAETDVPENILQEWLDMLCAQDLLHHIHDNGSECWAPARDPDTLFLTDIHHALADSEMHIPDDWHDTSIGKTLAGLYFRLEREHTETLGQISLRHLMQQTRDET
ncbi:MAG: YihY family inner membrane protein [Mariprofundaceae bacterium]